jgi:3-hydroxyisobutyrate dehydrogenase
MRVSSLRLTCAALCALAAMPAQAATTASTGTQAEVLDTIQVAVLLDMDFGRIAVGGAGGVVVIDPNAGSRSCDPTLVCVGSFGTSELQLTGSDASVQVNFDPTFQLTGPGVPIVAEPQFPGGPGAVVNISGGTTVVNVSFLGLGVMGGAIARHIGAPPGTCLTLYNRSPDAPTSGRRSNPGLAVRAFATSPAEAAPRAPTFVLTCVGNDDDLADVVLGPQGVFSTCARRGVFIDHTTVSARIARQIAVEARDKQVHCVDAPMTGSQIGAEKGHADPDVRRPADAIEAASPVMEAYSKRIVHVGKAGAGQTTKMVNQICIAGVVAGLSRSAALCPGGAPRSWTRSMRRSRAAPRNRWQMDNRWHTMAKDEFDFGFAIDWMRKDLGLAMDEGRGSAFRCRSPR